MNEMNFVLKGNICYSQSPDSVRTVENGYLVCEDGKSAGVFEVLPEKYQTYPLTDFKNCLVIPGLTDLHIHAPQYAFRGLAMDLELLDWLNTHTFPEESKYADLEYAKKAYTIFAEAMKRSATTRACIFATIHRPATLLLMDLLESTGLKTMVGKVNMDRNSPDELREESAEKSAEETIAWLRDCDGRYENVSPVLTPRFIPSCSDELMGKLSEIQERYDLPVQSHLSENPGEVEWVKALCPSSSCYGDAYDVFGLFGGKVRTIMAHCVYSGEEETRLLKDRKVFVAHCPQSNTNLASGIAPVRRFLDMGIPMGLGTDVAGGTGESVFRAMADAVQASKLRWRLQDDGLRPLTAKEAFYLGTVGGGAFFGNVGSFQKGYELDALIMDDTKLSYPQSLSLWERLERMIYLSDDRHIVSKYVSGRKVF